MSADEVRVKVKLLKSALLYNVAGAVISVIIQPCCFLPSMVLITLTPEVIGIFVRSTPLLGAKAITGLIS